MAVYGFDIKPIGRLQGSSVSKTASYILRQNVRDEYMNTTHYYAYKNDVTYSGIMLPDNAPLEYQTLEKLLAAIDRAEKRYDARTGRVVRLSLPNDREISDSERIKLVQEYVKEAFIDMGMCAVIAIHEGKNADYEKNNPHAHILLTDRPISSEGFCKKKNREWNRVVQLRKWRRLWAEKQNELFKHKGLVLQVSHESLEVQGIDRIPTIPLGRESFAMEKKGIRTERGNKNREIAAANMEKEAEWQRKKEKSREKGRGYER